MTTIATESRRLSNWLKWELAPEVQYTRKQVIVNEATAQTYITGTVLGKITANGKYIISKQAAADGSQVPDAIVIFDASIPATTDTPIAVLIHGPAIVTTNILLDASFGTAPQIAAAYAALEAKYINVQTAL